MTHESIIHKYQHDYVSYQSKNGTKNLEKWREFLNIEVISFLIYFDVLDIENVAVFIIFILRIPTNTRR